MSDLPPDPLDSPDPADGRTDEPSQTEAELNALRIRQISRVHRAAIRARSYCLIGVTGCAVAAIEIARRVVIGLHSEAVSLQILTPALISVPLLVLVSIRLFLLARKFGDEANRSELSLPTTPPDFSALSDGSQFSRNLEQMQDDQEIV
jgi:hypothetical protein